MSTTDDQNNGTSDGIGYILKQIIPDILGSGLGAGLLTSGLVNLAGGDGLEALSYGAMAGGKSSDIYQDYLQTMQRQQNTQKPSGQETTIYNQSQFLPQQDYAGQQRNNYDMSRQNYERSLQALLNSNRGNIPQAAFPYQRSRNVSGYGNY